MSVELESAARLNALKQGIEAKTGETYPDLTGGVQALMDGFGHGGGDNDFVGVKYSDFDSVRGNPRVADARSLPVDNAEKHGGFPYLFASYGANPNNGWNTTVQDFYLPDGLPALSINMFYYTGAIKNIYGDLSNVVRIQTSCFHFSNIEKFDYYLPALNVIDANAFNKAVKLTVLTLRGERLVTLANANAFINSAIASGIGYIYVPSAHIDSYKAATNWSVYADQFRALEDYTVDGTITGDLDESRI